MDKHTLATISIIGNSLDVLGALYLAYDLLGGEHGPLRTLTRAVTYGALFGTGYGLALGPVFGLASGLTHGITLAWEFSRASRHEPKPGFWLDTAMSPIRGAGFALGASYSYGAPFGVTFGMLSTAGQAFAYRIGIRPTIDYKPATRPRITRWQLLAAANRTAGYAVAGYASSLVARQPEQAIAVGLKAGLTLGVVTLLHALCRMDGRSRARKAHGGLGRWSDSDRLHSSIHSVLAGVAGCERSVGEWLEDIPQEARCLSPVNASQPEVLNRFGARRTGSISHGANPGTSMISIVKRKNTSPCTPQKDLKRLDDEADR